MTETGKSSRRDFLKVATGVVVAGAVAGAVGYYGGLGSAPKGATETVTQTQTVTQTTGATSTSSQLLAGKTVNVGVVEPLTGPLATFGASGVAGLKLAASEINSSGGILGAQVNLNIQDFGADASVATTATEKLITTNNVIAIMGPFASDAALAMGPVTEKYQIPFVTIGGSADQLYKQGWKYIFGITPRQSTFTQLVMSYLGEVVKPKTCALVQENSLMGQSGEQAEAAFAAQYGWQVVANQSYTAHGTDYTSILLNVKAANPDVVIFNSYLTDLVLLMQEAQQVNLNPLMFASTGGAGSQIYDFIKLAGANAEYLVGGMEYWGDKMWPDPTAVHNLDAKLRAQYNVPADFQSECAYTQLYILKASIEAAGSLDPTAIRNAMVKLDSVLPWFGWNKYAPTGLEFAPNSSFGSMQPVGIVQVQNGSYVTIWPDEYASGKLVYPMPSWSQRTSSSTTT